MRFRFYPYLALFLLGSCNQVDFTAPDGTTLTISAQPTSIAENGNSILTVTGTRFNGAPAPDGVVVRFTVDGNLGTITPNPIELHDGVGTATFHAAGRSGTVTITASSGNAEAVSVEIAIGDERATRLVLTANPSGLPLGGGKVFLKAFVFDEDGNPISGIQVFFSTDAGTLASHGSGVTTDGGGTARDTLTTKLDAEVTATSTVEGVEDSVTIQVAQGEPPTCSAVISPTEVEVDQEVHFLDTSTDPDGAIVRFFWDFGDGRQAFGKRVSHRYREAGSFIVAHTVTDDQRFTAVCTPITVTVTEPPETQSFAADPLYNFVIRHRVRKEQGENEK
jgi:hypothetical protein